MATELLMERIMEALLAWAFPLCLVPTQGETSSENCWVFFINWTPLALSSKGSKGQSVCGHPVSSHLPRKDGSLQVLIDPSVCRVQSQKQIQPGTRQTGLLSQHLYSLDNALDITVEELTASSEDRTQHVLTGGAGSFWG